MYFNIRAVTTATSTDTPTQTRRANFGAVVSAIRHGDLDAAKSAFDALQAAGTDRLGGRSKAFFAAVGQAIASGDPEAAKAALKSFHYTKPAAEAVVPAATDAATVPATDTTVTSPGSTVEILV